MKREGRGDRTRSRTRTRTEDAHEDGDRETEDGRWMRPSTVEYAAVSSYPLAMPRLRTSPLLSRSWRQGPRSCSSPVREQAHGTGSALAGRLSRRPTGGREAGRGARLRDQGENLTGRGDPESCGPFPCAYGACVVRTCATAKDCYSGICSDGYCISPAPHGSRACAPHRLPSPGPDGSTGDFSSWSGCQCAPQSATALRDREMCETFPAHSRAATSSPALATATVSMVSVARTRRIPTDTASPTIPIEARGHLRWSTRRWRQGDPGRPQVPRIGGPTMARRVPKVAHPDCLSGEGRGCAVQRRRDTMQGDTSRRSAKEALEASGPTVVQYEISWTPSTPTFATIPIPDSGSSPP